MKRNHDFQSIRSEGGLLPPDLLRRVLDPREKLPGTLPEDYGLPKGERLNEVITQSWNRTRKHWAEFRLVADALPETEPGTGLTNEKWTLPLLRELGFGLLPTSAGPELGGRTYAINRFLGPVPVHLVGCGLSLDRRAAGVRGAAAANPHGLVQDFLNRSPGSLWGIVSNGLRFRILRDSQALSRQSFLEFDLDAMFGGELYSDFVLLWLIGHATRFAARDGGRPETCWLEEWTKLAEQQGTRALGELRGGVEKALQILGEGFTSHPKNTDLRDALRTGRLSPADFHGQLLRVVYRLIFLFVAEDRTLEGLPLLHPRDDSEDAHKARERYAAHYGTARLREMASRIKGSRHGDLWRQFQILVGALSGESAFASARQHLALPSLGSFLWSPASTAALNDAELTNHDFLEALRHLAFTRQGKVLRPVDYKNLGAEELGGVYESLLALSPQISADGARFTFAEFAGSERKMSGSYYTPDSLVQCLLDSSLDIVVEEAIKGKSSMEAENALLSLKICDPAVGSGHFLVGAAHRLARHLARVRALSHGESEPSPLLYQQALRDVISHCLYGVDMNPMAAELCRVSLWLEALEPGKPLSFLNHHIRIGNSLLGTTPELIAGGLPDDAFNSIEGDDKKACSALKKRNKAERRGIGGLFIAEDEGNQEALRRSAFVLESIKDDTPDEVRKKTEAFEESLHSYGYVAAKRLADAWCAAFVMRKYFPPSFDSRFPSSEPFGLTQRHLNDLAKGLPLPSDFDLEVDRLASSYQLFHWHLAFPEVFAKGAFDCVIGNPPWERIQPEALKFFSITHPELLKLKRSDRNRAIAELATSDPVIFREWIERRREYLNITRFLKCSGRFPLSTTKNVNSYAVFQELSLQIVSKNGRTGMVLQSGIATDDINKELFGHIVKANRLERLLDFENRNRLFPDIDSRMRFCLLTCRGEPMKSATPPTLAFGLASIDDLLEKDRTFSLSQEEFSILAPNTGLCPTFRTKQDAELVLRLYLTTGVFVDEAKTGGNPWKASIRRIFSMAYDSGGFIAGTEAPEPSADFSRVFEAKLFHQYDHRYASYRQIERGVFDYSPLEEVRQNPEVYSVPQLWARQAEIIRRLEPTGWSHRYLLGYRDVTNATNERTCIAAILPYVAPDDTIRIIFLEGSSTAHAALVANLNAFVLDYAARNCVASTHLSEYLAKQLPLVAWKTYLKTCKWMEKETRLQEWILPRVLELTYTAWDLEPFSKDCGWSGPPFRWDEERRFLLRCELDAAFFHLYLPATVDGEWKPARVSEGAVREETPEEMAELKRHFPTPRDAVAYIMDTFPIVRRKDEAKYNGDYRTKRVILEIYDEMAAAMRTGIPYKTRLDHPPGPPADEQGNFLPLPEWKPGQPKPNDWPSHIHAPKE
jgi:hypothetical protein